MWEFPPSCITYNLKCHLIYIMCSLHLFQYKAMAINWTALMTSDTFLKSFVFWFLFTLHQSSCFTIMNLSGTTAFYFMQFVNFVPWPEILQLICITSFTYWWVVEKGIPGTVKLLLLKIWTTFPRSLGCRPTYDMHCNVIGKCWWYGLSVCIWQPG